MLAYSSIVNGQCGIGTWIDINNKENVKTYTENSYGEVCNPPLHFSPSGNKVVPMIPGNHKGGCGFSGTGFIPTKVSKDSYEYMCKTFRLVFQTPVRKNKNSGNMFFYAMFDDGPNEDIPSIEPNWPFKEIK